MTESLMIAVLANVVTMLVATGGWGVAYWMQRDVRYLKRLEKKMVTFELEVRSRIALEKTACDWLAELTNRTHDAVKRELRNRARERSGLRPKLSESDLSI